MSQPPMPTGPPRQPEPQSWPQQEVQPSAGRGVEPDGSATDTASTPIDSSASTAGWTPPPWTAGPGAFWRRTLAGLLIAVALVLVGGVAGWYMHGIEQPASIAQPGPIAQPTTGESDVGELPLYDKLRVGLRAGDCYNLTGDLGDLAKEVPCTSKHELEVIHVGAMDEGSYPTSDGFVDYVIEYCDPAFAAYIGKSVDDSGFDYDWLVPSQDAWRSGDRTVRCAAYEPGNASRTRSLRGTQR